MATTMGNFMTSYQFMTSHLYNYDFVQISASRVLFYLFIETANSSVDRFCNDNPIQKNLSFIHDMAASNGCNRACFIT